jgi:hypothetical protein
MNDSERLDWIMAKNWLVTQTRDGEYFGIAHAYYGENEIEFETVIKAVHDTPRDALDAAIRKVGA